MKNSKRLITTAILLLALGPIAPFVVRANNLNSGAKAGCGEAPNVCHCCDVACKTANQQFGTGAIYQQQVANCKLDCTSLPC